jgi:indole-3-glycerol phosphate synthase
MTQGFLAGVLEEVAADLRRDDFGAGIPPPSFAPRPSFRSAIEAGRPYGALVVEYKRASPGSADPVFPARTIEEFARVTDVPGVVAYSCLATRPRFDGSPRDVAELASRTSKSVLYRDFVISRRQLDAAVFCGASAVLLIARLGSNPLLERPLPELCREAHQRGLEVLYELHDPAEIAGAAEVEADVFGVNPRDLETLAVDLSAADRTVEAAWDRGLKPLLGLGGIERPADARRFLDSGADGVLVGTAVARATDPAAFLGSLFDRPAGSGR